MKVLTKMRRWTAIGWLVALASLVAFTLISAVFSSFSVCDRCGAVRRTADWQLPFTEFTMFSRSTETYTPLSRVLLSNCIVAPHTHHWLFGHGGGNGVRYSRLSTAPIQYETEAMTHAEPIRAGTEQAVVPPAVTPPHVQAQAMPAIQLRPESIAIPTLEPNFSETVETENGRFAAIPRVVNTHMKADETHSAYVDVAPQPNVQIIPGETAPHYRLSSLEEYLEVARSRGGQLDAFDGTTCIGICTRLDLAGIRFHLLDHTWHEMYAERMTPLPQDAQPVPAAVARVAKAFPQMRIDRIEILLSLPNSLDRIIYGAQIEWFQKRRTDMNVCSLTEGSFSGTGPYAQFAVGKVESR